MNIQEDVVHDQLAYWKEGLAGAPTKLELPTDKSRPAVQSFSVATETVELSQELLSQLKGVSQQEEATKVGRGAAYVGWLLLALAVVLFLGAWFTRQMTELSVTNHRVIYKTGFIRRHTVEMNMDKVETVNVDQSILGRILSYGTIHVLGTGQGGINSLHGMGSPITVRNAITAG